MGVECDAEALKNALDSKLFNNLTTVFRQSLNESNKANYKQLSSDSERRSYIAQFVLDPSIAKTTGFNKVSAVNSNMSRST